MKCSGQQKLSYTVTKPILQSLWDICFAKYLSLINMQQIMFSVERKLVSKHLHPYIYVIT